MAQIYKPNNLPGSIGTCVLKSVNLRWVHSMEILLLWKWNTHNIGTAVNSILSLNLIEKIGSIQFMIRYSYLSQTLLPHTTYVPELSPCTTYTLGCQLHYVIFCRDDLLYLMYNGRCLIIGIRVGLVESTSEKGF